MNMNTSSCVDRVPSTVGNLAGPVEIGLALTTSQAAQLAADVGHSTASFLLDSLLWREYRRTAARNG
jgi:hypothetical protein